VQSQSRSQSPLCVPRRFWPLVYPLLSTGSDSLISRVARNRQPLANNIAADTALLQQAFRSETPIAIHTSNPWAYATSILTASANDLRLDGGSRAIWLIVSNYNSKHLRDRRMSYCHLSGAALSVWVSRNWTADEIVAAAAAIIRSTYPAFSWSSLVEVRSIANLPISLGSIVGYHWKCCGMVDVGEEFHPTDVVGGPDKRFIVAGVSKSSALVAYDWGNGWELGIAAAAYVNAASGWHLLARWNLVIRPSPLSQLIEQTSGLPLGIAQGQYFDKEPDLDNPHLFPEK
jgi:hypothetical protein